MSRGSLKNSCVHLTNYSINKHSEKFDDDDDESGGHKWSLSAFREHLASCGIDDKLLFDRINDLVVRTLLSVEPSVRSACAMYQTHHACCFELLGFDILVQDNLRPWLIEVNLSPSLACGQPIDRKIKSTMLADLFNVVGIAAKPPHSKEKAGSKRKQQRPPKRPKPVLDEARYSYLGDLSSFSTEIMGDISVEDRRTIKEVSRLLPG
eukprot:TRINITY_DN3693_c0_g7_i3.p1 TRINITY_DN3693_c0_g7~~TRINITY_DN3693_c0_g7_i3.p1  ORF type:complete len:208 (-),score=54.81 TRINITY_DN3693_c0_g7_i3:139-762(-)